MYFTAVSILKEFDLFSLPLALNWNKSFKKRKKKSNTGTFVCCRNKMFWWIAITWRHMLPSARNRKALLFSPPPWSRHWGNAAWKQSYGDKRPSCVTHLFIKRWRLSATDLSEPRDQSGRWVTLGGWRTFHRLARPPAAKPLFTPAELVMTRRWQNASLRMTKQALV